MSDEIAALKKELEETNQSWGDQVCALDEVIAEKEGEIEK